MILHVKLTPNDRNLHVPYIAADDPAFLTLLEDDSTYGIRTRLWFSGIRVYA